MIIRWIPVVRQQNPGPRGEPDEVLISAINRVPVGGDVILSVQGREMTSTNELNSLLDKFKPGETKSTSRFCATAESSMSRLLSARRNNGGSV